MTSITAPARPAASGHIRPLNILRDLPKVADLIELCFASNLDSEGKSYVRQMRHASSDASFMQWARNAVEGASMPLSGFVWEEDGRLVGNASLVPFHRKSRRIYLIANVATHPDFRRKGIARALTERTMQLADQRGATELWLHVRADNPGALEMYADLGFEQRAWRNSWHSQTHTPPPPASASPTVARRPSRLWPQQLAWLNQLHPEELAWYRAWNWKSLKPGLWNWLYRAFVEFEQRQWAGFKGGQLQGVLAWTPTHRADLLWLACGPDSDASTLTSLLSHARRELGFRRRLILEHPADRNEAAIQAAGFALSRTLVWMRARGATP
jgi:ribosomal protein S18 acetylase RimI-like enzyme